MLTFDLLVDFRPLKRSFKTEFKAISELMIVYEANKNKRTTIFARYFDCNGSYLNT